MRVSSVSSSLTPAASMQQRMTVHETSRAKREEGEDSTHQARLTAIVELIKKLTGRDVKLVPPSPYLVSGPVAPKPVTVEFVASEAARDDRERDRDEPITVDISDVIERGTSSRMRLSDGAPGTLVLQPELDLAL